MNEMVLEQVELLVTRQLDGRLTADEQVELEDICTREPQAERLAVLLRQDHQALCAALQQVLPTPLIPSGPGIPDDAVASPTTESRATLEHANPDAGPDRTYTPASGSDYEPEGVGPAISSYRLRLWHRLRPLSALAAGIAVLFGVGLAYWSGPSSPAPTKMAKVTPSSGALPAIPFNGPGMGVWNTAAAPAPPGSMVLVHDTGAPAGWVKDSSLGGPTSRPVPEYLGVKHGNSVFLIELPSQDQTGTRY